MIIRLSDDTTRIGFRLRDWKHSRFLLDWRNLQMVIHPGQRDQPCWVPGGSPIILHGYWPGTPTDVDIANPPPPDFPAIVMNAFESGDDCTVVFLLPERFRSLPYGRYTGILRWLPDGPIKVVNWQDEAPEPPVDYRAAIPEKYKTVCRQYCKCQPPAPIEPPKQCCVLGTFDIDLGQRADEHIIDLVTVDYALNVCDEEC